MTETEQEHQVAYAAFADELYRTNIISDPWIEGRERFRLEPIVLSDERYRDLRGASEAIGRAYDELAQIIWENPELLDSYFGLTPYQKAMWLAAGGRWHGIARLDLFILEDGSIAFCEMNSDTPSGEAETVLINRLRHSHHPELIDPNSGFEERFVEMVLASHGSSTQENGESKPTIGILYPTDLPEDLSMIALYRSWFESRGHRVILGSPYNIHPRTDGGIALFDLPVDLLIRHYKTDWWGERVPAWDDEDDYIDPDPLDPQTIQTLEADAAGMLTVINPFGSVVTQNKFSISFLWDQIDRFSPRSQEAIRRYVPVTRRLDDLDRSSLPKEEWVLKSDFGCEGEEVVIGRYASDEIWQKSLEQASRGRWVAQRYFNAAMVEDDMIPNYGVYIIGGEVAGLFTRLANKATDYTSVVGPTFVKAGQG